MGLDKKIIEKIASRNKLLYEYDYQPIENGEGGEEPVEDGANIENDSTQVGDGEITPTSVVGSNSEEKDDNVAIAEEGDEVIDIDDLTNAMEVTEIKIDGIDDKLLRLEQSIQKLNDMVANNNLSIESLRQEMVMRNPTKEEIYNHRSNISGPYNKTAEEFLNDKINEYSGTSFEKEYILRKSDLKGLNPYEVAKSINVPSLKEIMN